ncbi:MAG TPA: sulfur oxidation c-type cytochrome SoxX [Sedimenticola thiotaurini]|uniref:Sulfur oxidation c-type cytochrome SoxX n=1 Tax=Sedimenticola thiotaurini TaxID=1543721 RepID=A0A831W9N7_9GAMM|nr:sulfur oxidation c-type cytochrome SoxX [Sedimenticola thiotaurini]
MAGQLAVVPGAAAEGNSALEEGKKLAFSRKKGNCLACHMIEGGTSPGNVGPPLIAMKARYPDRAKLRAQIWDASQANPDTAMVLFGRYQVLTEKEIDKVVDFIWSL